jgi:hypothetical protein
MNRQEFDAFRNGHYDAIVALNTSKGHDYAGDEDALANFKKDSERFRKIAANDPTMAKWYVYYEAVMTYLEEGGVQSEPIEGRIHDAILYLFLLLGLIEDSKPEAEVLAFSEPVFATASGGAPPQATPPVTDVPGVEKAKLALGATQEGCQSTIWDRSTDARVQCNRPMNHGDLHWGRTSLGHALEWSDSDPEVRSS